MERNSIGTSAVLSAVRGGRCGAKMGQLGLAEALHTKHASPDDTQSHDEAKVQPHHAAKIEERLLSMRWRS